MTTPTNQLIRLGHLRQRAYALLNDQGQSAHIAASASAALSVLHELASSPDTAADALALLHELQVHQVEIEMQSEDLRTSLTEADAALNHQVQYLDGIPVACINIDRFKRVNDLLGYDAGDHAITAIGHRIDAFLRHESDANGWDVGMCRLSGDEFAILLEVVGDRDGLERVRQQVQMALKEPLQALGDIPLEDVDFGGSVGEALFPDDGRDAETLLRKADRRMYNQKFSSREGGNVSPLRRSSDSRL